MVDHDEHAAFLAAVRASPEDDLPRLVYADWLDEHGEHERAEFIRVQCELARMDRLGAAGSMSAETDRKIALRRRERELWDRHKGEWFGERWAILNLSSVEADDSPLDTLTHAVVTRGFVSEVRCRLADWIGGECGRCEGGGRVTAPNPAFTRECPACDGTGRTPGVGPQVVAAHPVEVVRVGDREPYRFGRMSPAVLGTPGPDEFRGRDTHFWLTTGDYSQEDLPNRLPVCLRPFLGGHIRDCGPAPLYDVIGHYFDTREAAVAALSAALITFSLNQLKSDNV